MPLNVTVATFPTGCNTAVAQPSLVQWDRGQILQFAGFDLPVSYQVEFSSPETVLAIPAIGDSAGVEIPNVLLQSSAPITAYLVLHEGEDDRETERWATIYVKPRKMPPVTEPDPEQEDIVDQAIAALQQAVSDAEGYADDAAGSADVAEAAKDAIQDMGVSAQTGAAGSAAAVTKTVDPETGAVTLTFTIPKGDQGNPGDPGEDGYSPTITITTITGGHRVTITDAEHPSGQSFDVLNGSKGDPGDDGYSPAVTITSITGGHRVTITDEDHPSGQSFDVLNGSKGDPGNTGAPGVIQSVNGKSAASVTLDAGDLGYDDTETYSSDTVGAELSSLNSHLSVLEPAATSSDVGKALKVKTVSGGKVTEYEYGDTGGATFIVTLTPTSLDYSGTMDKTVAEIYAAHQAGQTIIYRVLAGVDEYIDVECTMVFSNDDDYPSFNAFIIDDGNNVLIEAATGATNDGTTATYFTTIYPLGCDTQMSDSSTNPVQNRVIKAYVDAAGTYGMNVVKDLSSTDITLAAQAETRYIYGELASLTVSSLPSEGLVDILFTSGTTATVVSLPNTVKMPSWFSVGASMTVEISILDGVYGSVQTWAS